MAVAVVLAAGEASRMGSPKLLLPLPNGLPMLRTVVETALASDVLQVMVVVEAVSAEMEEVCAGLTVTWIVNPDARRGMSTSLQAAIHRLRADFLEDAVVFLLGDQPGVQTQILNRVIAVYEETKSAVVQAKYRGVFGHPVLFDPSVFDELLEISGDEGGRSVVARHRVVGSTVEVDEDVPPDIDIPADYQRLWHQS